MKNICAILLAAGKSTRMNEPKPLLKWKEGTLLEYQVNQLAKLPFQEIIVVLGCHAETILNTVSIHHSRVSLIECQNYKDGLSSSLKYGLRYAAKECDGVLLLLVDMPFIQIETMKLVLEAGAHLLENNNVPFAIQPRFQNQAGHPVFIGNFDKLNWNNLHGDVGAKPLIQQLENHQLLETDDFGVIFDIDTPQAYLEALHLLTTTNTAPS